MVTAPPGPPVRPMARRLAWPPRLVTRLATRVSINLEGPNDAVVSALAREKRFSADLLPSLTLAGRLSREARLEGRPGVAPAGTTTQFVVGAQGERDREILNVVGRLEGQGLLHHDRPCPLAVVHTQE